MSRRSSNKNEGQYRKPKADLYTVLLLLAFGAIIVSCILLYKAVKPYGTSPWSGAPSAEFRQTLDQTQIVYATSVKQSPTC